MREETASLRVAPTTTDQSCVIAPGDRSAVSDAANVTLYLKAFNAWATGTQLTQLRYTPRESVPPIATDR